MAWRARTALRLPRSFSTFMRARGARANVDRRDRRRVRGRAASRTQNASKLPAGERNGKWNARQAPARLTRRRRRNRTRVSPRARRRAPSRHGSRSRAWTSPLRASRIDASSHLATSHGSTRRGSRTRGRITASPARKARRPPAFPFGIERASSWAGMLHGRLFFVKNTAGAEPCDRPTGNDSDIMTTATYGEIKPPGESVKSGNCGVCRLDGARAPVAWLDKAWSRGAPSRRIAPAPRRAP